MKIKATLVLAVALAGGAAAFTWRAVRPAHESTVREPELSWLQKEFALSDAAVLRIAELHRKYTAECEPMCETLHETEAEISRLLAADRQVTPRLKQAMAQSSQLVAECQRRMVEHFYAVAKEMPAEAGERYLALMSPVAAQPGHGWMRMKPRAPKHAAPAAPPSQPSTHKS